MKLRILSLALAVTVLVSACGTGRTPSTVEQPTPTTTLPAPQVLITHVPDASTAAQTFLDAWQAENYPQMYALLTRESQGLLTEENFIKLYTDTANSLTLSSLETGLLTPTIHPAAAVVPYQVTYKTTLFGDLTRDMKMNLVMASGGWKIQWHDGLILPEMQGGNRLALDLTVQPRGEILDRSGSPLVHQADAYALGVDPGAIDPEQEGSLVSLLARLTGNLPKWIKSLWEFAAPGYIPVGETLAETLQSSYDTLSNMTGVYANPFSGRFYTEGGLAPQVTGYALGISAEELQKYTRLGYRQDEQFGQSGLEAWGEDYLRGKPGAMLRVVDPNGQDLSALAQVTGQPSQDITTTLDMDLQREAQRSLDLFSGAIVVLERDTGRVLAMASSPGYDPNGFNGDYYYRSQLLNQAFDGNTNPLVNRAAMGSGYPLGSVFKIITTAAALESGLYTAEEPQLACPYTWEEIPGITLYDWTYQKEKPESSTLFPDGTLNLEEALMRSCNPWFYHIGLDLYRKKGMYELSNMARGFGLGSRTGIGQVEEITGAMPDPVNETDAAQLAIGQGQMAVTPLQVARFVAAVGNGGTLYRPQLVEQIAAQGADPTYTFEAEATGKLPVKQENLSILQGAMRRVTSDRLGTAYTVFGGMSLPIYGKTGTAETGEFQDSHAWFAGYTDAGRENQPDIAVVVLAENAGEGSEIAAPIFRRMLEVYFFGRLQRLFPWESEPYVTRTPTPLVTDTPVVIPTDTPAVTDTPAP